jgi:hypothetical protein
MEVDAAGSQDVDLTAAAPVYSVEFKVKMVDGTPLPEPLEMTLVADDATLRRIPTRTAEKDTVRFNEVPAGRWNVLVGSKELWLAVIGIESGGGLTADSRIVVRDRRVVATAVIAQGKTNVEGFAKKGGKGEAGVMIVLVPKDPAASLALFRRDQSDSDGSFLLRDASPGEYTVVAIEDGWSLDWAKPEIISRYVHNGTQITVPRTAGQTLRVDAPVEVQMR